ncbi:MAG: hypothetical protein IJY09_03000 [Lachnospiraceae bacterium]|nr:hypothetical protein [Lachnospiraceae bacterium]
MFQKAWHDYWDSFRWRNIKKIYNNFTAVWAFIYFATIPAITRADKNMIDLGTFYIWLIALYFGILSASVVRIRLPKQMFLCPMSATERKSYLKNELFLKLTVPVVVAVLVTVVNILRGKMPFVCLMVALFSCVCMTICLSITTWPGSIWYNNQMTENLQIKRVNDPRFKGLMVWSLTGFGIGLLMQMSIMMFMERSDMESKLFWIFTGIGCVLQLLLAIRVLCYTPTIIEVATDYEKTFDVERILEVEKA